MFIIRRTVQIKLNTNALVYVYVNDSCRYYWTHIGVILTRKLISSTHVHVLCNQLLISLFNGYFSNFVRLIFVFLLLLFPFQQVTTDKKVYMQPPRLMWSIKLYMAYDRVLIQSRLLKVLKTIITSLTLVDLFEKLQSIKVKIPKIYMHTDFVIFFLFLLHAKQRWNSNLNYSSDNITNEQCKTENRFHSFWF